MLYKNRLIHKPTIFINIFLLNQQFPQSNHPLQPKLTFPIIDVKNNLRIFILLFPIDNNFSKIPFKQSIASSAHSLRDQLSEKTSDHHLFFIMLGHPTTCDFDYWISQLLFAFKFAYFCIMNIT